MKAIRHIPIGESYSFGWSKTFQQFGFILTFMLIGMALHFALWFLQMVTVGAVSSALGDSGPVMFLFIVARWVLNVILAMAGISATLQMADGKRPTLSTAFAGMTEPSMILNYVLVSVIVGILVSIGLIFLIIPGIYFSLKYFFTGYVVVDRKANFTAALSKSSDITSGVMMELIGFNILSFLINLAGLMVFGIGLIVTMPMTEIARAYVYRHLMKAR